jgi:hypothetical protein
MSTEVLGDGRCLLAWANETLLACPAVVTGHVLDGKGHLTRKYVWEMGCVWGSVPQGCKGSVFGVVDG